MKPLHRFSQLLAASAFFGLATLATAEEIPAQWTATWPEVKTMTTPVWVAADQAFDRDGRLREELFLPEHAERIRRNLARPVDPVRQCTVVKWRDESYVNPPDRSTLQSAVASSELVLHGRVLERRFGFERGDMGQLLLIQPIEQIKPADRQPALPYFYGFVPAGLLQIGPHRICKENPSVVIPEVGDEVLLFPNKFYAGEPFLNLEFDGSLIALRKNGSIDWPRPLSLAYSSNRQSPRTGTKLIKAAQALAKGAEPVDVFFAYAVR